VSSITDEVAELRGTRPATLKDLLTHRTFARLLAAMTVSSFGDWVGFVAVTAIKTRAAVELLKRLGVTGKAVLVDVALDENLARSVRNVPGISIVQSRRLTAREVMDAVQVVATRGALEKLQEALA